MVELFFQDAGDTFTSEMFVFNRPCGGIFYGILKLDDKILSRAESYLHSPTSSESETQESGIEDFLKKYIHTLCETACTFFTEQVLCSSLQNESGTTPTFAILYIVKPSGEPSTCEWDLGIFGNYNNPVLASLQHNLQETGSKFIFQTFNALYSIHKDFLKMGFRKPQLELEPGENFDVTQLSILTTTRSEDSTQDETNEEDEKEDRDDDTLDFSIGIEYRGVETIDDALLDDLYTSIFTSNRVQELDS